MHRCIYFILGTVFLISACSSGGGGGGGAGGGVPGNNANLSALVLSAEALDQVFQSNQTIYTAAVGFLAAATTVTPTAEDGNATVSVNATVVESGAASDFISLGEGANLVTIVVTAEDGITTTTYSVTVTRQLAASFGQQAFLKASNANTNDLFGAAVALSGDTLVVGAAGEGSSANGGEADNSAPGAGAVYVFTRNNGVWTQQQPYLKASNADPNDKFGSSLALSGDTLVVGAVGEGSSANGGSGDNSAPAAGAAYVFVRNNNGVWLQQPYLKASNANANDLFGNSVALSDDVLAVGAVGESSSAGGGEADNSAPNAGAVYVFLRNNNGVWVQQPYLKASNADAGDQFGLVAISGNTLAVGAVGEGSSAAGGEGDNSAPGAGAVYVFVRNNNGVWVQQPYLKASNANAGDLFGLVTLSGDTLVIGAVDESSSAVGGEGDNSAPGAGAAYVFMRTNNLWMQQFYLKASNANANDQFGWVGLSGDTLITGAFGEGSSSTGGEGDNSAPDAGAGYVFQ